MKTMTERKDDIDLDLFFAAAREDDPAPSTDFMARMEAQALAALPDPAPRRSLWSHLMSAVGGWPGVAGLAAACAVGVWIGVVSPDGINTLFLLQDNALGTIGVDPLSGFDLAMMEG